MRHAKQFGVVEPNLKLAINEQSKILHDISDRLTAQDARWCALEASVALNSSSIQHLETTMAAASSSNLRSKVDARIATTFERLDTMEAAAATRVGALESATVAFES
jgi:hypothetical protein